jgi:hypothetical protein
VAIVAGCGDSKPSSQAPPAVSGSGAHLSQPISLADCTDWKDGTVDERLGTIGQLRKFAGGPVVGASAKDPSGTGAVLDDDKAYDLIDSYCANEFARGFKLYKLYERAAAFEGKPSGSGTP